MNAEFIKEHFVGISGRAMTDLRWTDVRDINQLLHDHLSGHQRLALSPFTKDRTTIRWAVIEAEDHGAGKVDDPRAAAFQIKGAIEKHLGPALVEISKSGNFHVWMFFDPPALASNVRKILKAVLAELELPQCEIFPKQDDLLSKKSDGTLSDGNAVFLPSFGGRDELGGGVRNGRTVFIDEQGNIVAQPMFQKIGVERVIDALALTQKTKKLARQNCTVQNNFVTRPGLDDVRKKCLFFQHVEDSVTNVSEQLWEAWISNARVFEGGREYIHYFSRQYAPPSGKQGYSEHLTDRKIERASAPVRCETIRAHGFTGCPTGGCGVSSPACLAGTIATANIQQAGILSRTTAQAPQVSSALDDLAADFSAELRGERRTLSTPYPRLTDLSALARPGSTSLIAGPANAAKTLLALSMYMYWRRQNIPSLYLPLEGRRADMQRRLLAMLLNTWSVLDDNEQQARRNLELLEKHKTELEFLTQGIAENPMLPVVGPDGRAEVQVLTPGAVIEWLQRMISVARVLIIDPLTQISFDQSGVPSYVAQADFMRKAVGAVEKSTSTLIIVCHTTKGSGRTGRDILTPEEIEGSSLFNRLAHSIVLLNQHEEMAHDVYRAGGTTERVEHKLTIFIAKSRHGKGGRCRLAFRLDEHGPIFHELGVIAPRSRHEPTKGWVPRQII